MLDVIIRGGRLADGSGRPAYRADVGLTRDTITRIGKLDGEKAKRTIDAKGLVVSPGFVDVHTHSDITLLVNPKAESAVRQGVTTHVFPNCGMGLAPAVGAAREDVEERVRPFGIEVDWTTVGEYFRRVEASRPSINVVPMVAQGTVRMAVMGYSKASPSRAELRAMKQHIEEAMRSGARGMCSGLRYVPSGYATEDELVELAKVVKRYGGLYATHMRSEGDNGDWFAAIDEALAIGRGSGVPVQISHMKALGSDVWGKSSKALALIRSAKRNGLDVMVDQYPYTASSSTLFVLFPQWSQEGGVSAFLERVDDPAQGDRIRTAFEKTLSMRGGAPRMTVSEYEPDQAFEGKTLAQVAKLMGAPEFEAAVRLLKESDGKVSMIYHTLEEPDVHRIFRAPFVMVASDGSAVAPYGKLAADYYPHPRNYGCFPKALGDFVRKKKLVTLEAAVRKMTYLPARRFGLEDRGLLRAGWRADLVAFDPRTVADRATFEHPREYPAGIAYVFVNGQMVVERGEHTGKRPGKVLFASGRSTA
jgi:N-acyl-D-aspartate/D-glutamate deacylase